MGAQTAGDGPTVLWSLLTSSLDVGPLQLFSAMRMARPRQGSRIETRTEE